MGPIVNVFLERSYSVQHNHTKHSEPPPHTNSCYAQRAKNNTRCSLFGYRPSKTPWIQLLLNESLVHHPKMASTISNNNNNHSNDNNSDYGDIPEIELIIKASTIDGRRKGACLFCQEYFMDLYLLAELKTISLKVTTVDTLKPPPDFRSNFDSTPPPILIDREHAILENDKIERYIMKNIPGGHNLFISDKETATTIENLYSKFKLMLTKKDETSTRALLNQLQNINDHLERRGSRFLTGDTMCCFDCELMPRLQHIKVAGKYFADFEIPTKYTGIWRYMYNMYQLDAFTQSCPADQDIINHYKNQQGVKMKKHEELEMPTFSTNVPVNVCL